MLVDYVYCCSVNCGEFDSATAPLWSYYFNLVNPFFTGAAKWIQPLSQLSTQALLWLFAFSFSFYQIRRRNAGSPNAIFDASLVVAWIAFLFEVGLFFICPSWRDTHVTNLQSNTILAFFDNTDLLISSMIVVIVFQPTRVLAPKYFRERGGSIPWRDF